MFMRLKFLFEYKTLTRTITLILSFNTMNRDVDFGVKDQIASSSPIAYKLLNFDQEIQTH